MDTLRPPNSLSFEGNVSENWRRWIQQFRLYLNATGRDRKPEKVRCSTLLTVAGEDAVEIYNTFTFASGETDKIEALISKFQAYCIPKKNITFERHVFNTRNQRSDENVESYVTDLRKLAKTCEFGELRDSLIRDRIVCGIYSDEVRARLLRDPELTLTKAVDTCRTAELSKSRLKSIVESQTAQFVSAVETPQSSQYDQAQQNHPKSESRNYKPDRRRPNPSNSRTTELDAAECPNCGIKHEPRKCPAYGQECRKCHKRNHYARKCRMSQRSSRVNTLEETPEVNNDLFIGMVNTELKGDTTDWNITLDINETQVKLKLDTGAQCNVLPLSTYKQLTAEKLGKSRTKLISYSGHRILTVGKNTVIISHKEKFYPTEFQVIDQEGAVPILGLPSCLEIGLVQRISAVHPSNDTDQPGINTASCSDSTPPSKPKCKPRTNQPAEEMKTVAAKIIDEYTDVFQGLGCLDGDYHIKVDPSVPPVVYPARKIPFAIKDKFKDELCRMEKIGAITKVTEPSEWVSSIVVTEKKNGNLRICLDPRALNKAVQREHYPMKTVEEVAAELEGATVFSTLDASSGFWHIKLDEESSKLTTFNTPFGRYRFLRLPFGLNSAPEVFQRRMSQAFDDIDGTSIIMDDILIWGKDVAQHDHRLRQVLQRARDINLKLNSEKSCIQTHEVVYIGHIFSKIGVKPDPMKVQAITEMQAPQDKKELLRFMGMVNYLGKFIPNLSNVTQPLRELLQKETAWHWIDTHERAFNEIKKRITHEKILKYYEVTKPVTISGDSSSYGLGACLMQDGRPISYASRSLSKSEKNYAQIEKELLAIVFGCAKFHQYIYGKPVTIETDHKPLEYLFRKPLTAAPPRLQRMMLTLQKYDLHVVYKPGKSLYIADTLSRAPGTLSAPDVDDLYQVHTVQHLPVSPQRLERFHAETTADSVLQKLQYTAHVGWPSDKSAVHPDIREYWPIRDEISTQDGFLLRGERLIVPTSLRREMLSIIHGNHLGIEQNKKH